MKVEIKKVNDPGITVDTKLVVTVGEEICLYLRLEDLSIRFWFRIVDKFVVLLLLGTSYIYRFEKVIFQ